MNARFFKFGCLYLLASCSLQLDSNETSSRSEEYFLGKWLWAPHFQGAMDISEFPNLTLLHWSHEIYTQNGSFYKEYFLGDPSYPTIKKVRYTASGKWQELPKLKSIQVAYDSCSIFDTKVIGVVIESRFPCPPSDTFELKFVGGYWIRPFYDSFYGSTIQKWKKLNVD